MEGAPANWNTILTTQLYTTAREFQSAIRYYEDTLMRLDAPREYRSEYVAKDYSKGKDYTKGHYNARTHLVGAFKNMPPPKFPKDDSNVMKKGSTPEAKGARPC